MRRVPRDEVERSLEAQARSWPSGCAMCALIARGSDRPDVVAAGAHALCVLDRFAARRGHLLVVHRHHVESIAALPWEEYAALQAMAWAACRALEAALRPVRTFVASLGSAARRATSFPHTHVHVVPLFDGDERDKASEVFTWAHGVLMYDDDEEAAQLAARLRAAWPKAAAT